METYFNDFIEFIEDNKLLFIVIFGIILLYIYFKKNNTKIIFITQYYVPKNEERKKEINECLINNLNNDIINEIHLFIEKDYDFSFLENTNKNKLKLIKTDKRLSFYKAFNYSNDFSENDIIILANSDIYFNNTLSEIYNLDYENKFYALNRYDIKNNKLVLFDNVGSQDTWIWKPPINIIINNNINDYFDINDGIILGIGGCDNRIFKIVYDSGYEVKNASDKIQTIHNHKNDYREWDKDKSKLKITKKYRSNGVQFHQK